MPNASSKVEIAASWSETAIAILCIGDHDGIRSATDRLAAGERDVGRNGIAPPSFDLLIE